MLSQAVRQSYREIPASDVAALAPMAGLMELWAETLGDSRICVAVLDGPADLLHPSLARADITQADLFGRGDGGGRLGPLHGTHITSIIFGQHDDGPIRGIAPRCRGLVIPIYEVDEAGVACSQADLALAIREAIRRGAHIINVSGGELSPGGAATPELRAAIRHCVENRRLVVAAAGNDGCWECLHVPGALPAVLAVGAMDAHGQPLPSSNWGEIYRSQGLLAPGQGILGAVPGGGVAVQSGTSFAAAIVSGVAALLLSLQLKRGEKPNPHLIREALLRGASGCTDQDESICERILAGRLNIGGARSVITPGVTTMAEPSDNPGLDRTPDAVHPLAQGAPSMANPMANPIPPHGTDPSMDPHAVDFALAAAPPDAGSGIGSATKSRVAATERITPSCGGNCSCGCNGTSGKQLVYAIGKLAIDFGSRTRLRSLQYNFATLPGRADEEQPVNSPENLIRYMLGYRIPHNVDGAGTHVANGNLYDAKSILWVLTQDDCPLYAIRPEGPFAEAIYKQLIIFYLEQLGWLDPHRLEALGIYADCLQEFYHCYGNTQPELMPDRARGSSVLDQGPGAGKGQAESSGAGGLPEEKPSAPEAGAKEGITYGDVAALFGEDPAQANRVAIPGEITGKVQLYSGEVVEVIRPEERGAQNWNMTRLIQEITGSQGPGGGLPGPEALILALRILSTLNEEVRNPGKLPEDRARNFAASNLVFLLGSYLANPAFAQLFGRDQLVNVALDSVDVKPALCRRKDSEPYDVEISFFNFTNQFMGNVVLAQTIDVSDIVPVPEGRTRTITRRS